MNQQSKNDTISRIMFSETYSSSDESNATAKQIFLYKERPYLNLQGVHIFSVVVFFKKRYLFDTTVT